MTRRAYRLVKRERVATAFDGEGARRTGGRWNSPGVRMVYAAESLSLAQLEVLVHFQRPSALRRYAVVVVEFPEESITRVEEQASLPPDWKAQPPHVGTQVIGDQWIRTARSAVLSVPTVITPGERNFLFNPAHPDFARVILQPAQEFQFDTRLVGEMEAGRMDG